MRGAGGFTIIWSLLVCACRFTGGTPSPVPDLPGRNPEVYDLLIRSDVAYRFATTVYSSSLANSAETAKEAIFSVRLPKSAFISNFSMEIGGKIVRGLVKEKIAAKKEYDRSRGRGQSAGKVSAQSRNTNCFKISINVAARSKVRFNLTYQELLQRRLGLYEHVINIDPGQPVRNLKVEIYLRESREITFLNVPPLRTGIGNSTAGNAGRSTAKVTKTSSNGAYIIYEPSLTEQLQVSSDGITGRFVVQYDVKRTQDAGEIQVVDGYFVHYFAPTGLKPANKNVLFILDVSGSMAGLKIKQMKDAMAAILDELRPGDRFNVITFSSWLSFWSNQEMLEANSKNVKKAKVFIRKMTADGGTNINDAVLRGIHFLKHQPHDGISRPSIIIFLTDGEPTSGITNTDHILSNVRKTNQGAFSLFSLGFGHAVDFPFLQKLSLQNHGAARRIYEDSDADLQLRGFYSEVSSPILSDVRISYIGDSVELNTVTTNQFPMYFNGTEFVIAGKISSKTAATLQAKVNAKTSGGKIDYDTNVSINRSATLGNRSAFSNILETLWAYLTIQDLLKTRLGSMNATERSAAKQRALELSLKYSFVTPLTSMVVVRPEEPKTNVGQVKDEDVQRARGGTGRPAAITPYHRRRRPNHANRRTPFVDNDPHFIIPVRGIPEAVCFDINGRPGQIYQLVYDSVTGIVVNALVVGKPPSGKHNSAHPRTYLGRIAILSREFTVIVTPTKIKINDIIFGWKVSKNISLSSLSASIVSRKLVTVSLGEGFIFSVVRHKVRKGHPEKTDYLGFYVNDGSGLSSKAQGLIGQFHKRIIRYVTGPIVHKHGHVLAKLRIGGPHTKRRYVKAQLRHRLNMESHDHVPCWHVGANGAGLISRTHTDYLVPRLRYKKFSVAIKTIASLFS